MYAVWLIPGSRQDAYSGVENQGNGRPHERRRSISTFPYLYKQPGENVQSFHPLRAFLPPLTGRSAQSGVTHAHLVIRIYSESSLCSFLELSCRWQGRELDNPVKLQKSPKGEKGVDRVRSRHQEHPPEPGHPGRPEAHPPGGAPGSSGALRRPDGQRPGGIHGRLRPTVRGCAYPREIMRKARRGLQGAGTRRKLRAYAPSLEASFSTEASWEGRTLRPSQHSIFEISPPLLQGRTRVASVVRFQIWCVGRGVECAPPMRLP